MKRGAEWTATYNSTMTCLAFAASSCLRTSTAWAVPTLWVWADFRACSCRVLVSARLLTAGGATEGAAGPPVAAVSASVYVAAYWTRASMISPFSSRCFSRSTLLLTWIQEEWSRAQPWGVQTSCFHHLTPHGRWGQLTMWQPKYNKSENWNKFSKAWLRPASRYSKINAGTYSISAARNSAAAICACVLVMTSCPSRTWPKPSRVWTPSPRHNCVLFGSWKLRWQEAPPDLRPFPFVWVPVPNLSGEERTHSGRWRVLDAGWERSKCPHGKCPPDLRPFWGNSLTKLPFGVTSAVWSL